MDLIRVNLKRSCDDSYDVRIAKGALEELRDLSVFFSDADRCVIITDSNVKTLYGETVKRKLLEYAIPVDLIAFPAGETSKTMTTVLDVASQLMALHVSRKSVLVALGGGVVGDLTGFVASIFKRSVPFIQIATSLIAQVDSSVGGKTGVDLPEGKNLLGTFYQPKAVIIDPTCLDTLSEKDFKNGLAEIMKYGIIRDKSLFEILEQQKDKVQKKDPGLMQYIIMRSCRIKADIVEIDEKEGDVRRILNYGHTVGHALEAASHYGLSHGEAVAIGMVAAAELSSRLGYLQESVCRRITDLVRSYGLPAAIPHAYQTAAILGFMAGDKKAVGSQVHFVLIRDLGDPFMSSDVPQEIMSQTLEAMRV